MTIELILQKAIRARLEYKTSSQEAGFVEAIAEKILNPQNPIGSELSERQITELKRIAAKADAN